MAPVDGDSGSLLGRIITMQIDIRKAIFITPMGYDSEGPLSEPDMMLHGGQAEADLIDSGDYYFSVKDLPEGFDTGVASGNKIMHFETIKSPDGKRFFPLFDSYNAATHIFGKNIRVSMTCFDTAVKFAKSDFLDGIVVCPGTPGQQILDISQFL